MAREARAARLLAPVPERGRGQGGATSPKGGRGEGGATSPKGGRGQGGLAGNTRACSLGSPQDRRRDECRLGDCYGPVAGGYLG